MSKWHYVLFVFLGGCSYGILSTFVKLAYGAGLSVNEVTGGQYFIGTLIIWILVLFMKKRGVSGNQAIKLILSGIPFGLTGIFYYQSLQTLHASLAIIFLFQYIWIGSLLEMVFLKNKPSKEKLIAIGILLAGSLLAAGITSETGVHITWQGMMWGLLAAITFATFIFLSGTVGHNTEPLLKSALLSSGGLIVVFIIFPPVYFVDVSVLGGFIQYGLILGIFGAVLPPLLLSIGMPKVGPGLGTILTASELPVAVLMSALILREQVGVWQWFGVALILGGIMVSNVKMFKPRNISSPNW
ncbi:MULTISPECIES: EamA family transporter [Bacillaceae]|uniref:EamA family transporter n=1 Tax=Bacillaceae TaxID=186817 RepID=UPI001E562925|nr:MULTISPECIES: DMT family transporter [Bacillaceae]MCE4049411.1 DMT family transporter [Bacillus sp. Au-Bac7]MCM3034184.1 DMT family transporter [Niallia sp. MER 6]